MGFNSVYKLLQDVFPQVDARMLRAVAIEHTRDPDTAVEVVLTEVIPFLSGRSNPITSPTSNTSGIVLIPSETVAESSTPTLNNVVHRSDSTDLNEPHNGSMDYDVNGDGLCQNNSQHDYSHVTLNIREYGSNDGDEASENCDNKGSSMLWKSQESRVEVGSDQGSYTPLTTMKHYENGSNGSMNDYPPTEPESFCCPAGDVVMATDGMNHLDQSHVASNKMELKNAVIQVGPSSVQECKQDTEEDGLQLVAIPETLIIDSEKTEPFDTAATDKVLCTSPPLADPEDEFASCSVVSYSGQSCSIDLLEDNIADARSIKRTLFTAMEAVLRLMKEVELQEKVAEQAKDEAAKGGLDILTRKEDLEQALQHAMEANDMHTGEVYGEKAILATEVRELQSRLLSLSEGRDKYLAILDEMRQTLEVRRAAAENKRNEAELERMEKEVCARKALAEQEQILDRVVQESKILQKEAEENSKLREFLMDRGCVVDMLQGEISVICQDVKLLKEKFDDRLPLSKSLSSSQTSCILASSSSSLKSVLPDPAAPKEADSFEDLSKMNSATASTEDQFFSGDERDRDDHKKIVDDGWELFDNREFDV